MVLLEIYQEDFFLCKTFPFGRRLFKLSLLLNKLQALLSAKLTQLCPRKCQNPPQILLWNVATIFTSFKHKPLHAVHLLAAFSHLYKRESSEFGKILIFLRIFLFDIKDNVLQKLHVQKCHFRCFELSIELSGLWYQIVETHPRHDALTVCQIHVICRASIVFSGENIYVGNGGTGPLFHDDDLWW